MTFSGFKGKGKNECEEYFPRLADSPDPYSREDQANFAKWYVVGQLRAHDKLC
jgi:hypothetical protein